MFFFVSLNTLRSSIQQSKTHNILIEYQLAHSSMCLEVIGGFVSNKHSFVRTLISPIQSRSDAESVAHIGVTKCEQ